jgi:cytochrome c
MRHYLITILLTALSTTILIPKAQVDSVEINLTDQNQTVSDKSEPTVELCLSNIENGVSWGSQIRYSIEVNDEMDGASRYNEINPQEVFLEINFSPNNDSLKFQEDMNDSLNLKGLRLLGNSSCFGCHADKETMIGPSFSEISNGYPNDESTIDKLVSSIRHGSVGEWGDAEMPSSPGISEEDASVIAEYILMQGAKEYSWVYPGLEGVFRVIDQPQRFEQGKYVLTASYTSSLKMRGLDTKVISVE